MPKYFLSIYIVNLFIDTISAPASLILFNNEREIIKHDSFEIKGNESSKLIPQIDALLATQDLEYTDLENIVVVRGPGSFTGVRTTVLVANSINYIIKKKMTALSYFDLFDRYPIVKSSSKRDCFIQKTPESEIEILPNEEIEAYLQQENAQIFEKVDYISIIKGITLSEESQIEPLYIKKPNIS